MENIIELKIVPTRELFYNEQSSYGIYACEPIEPQKVKLNTYNNISIKGNTVIIVIADKSHKFQLNANLLYTACSRTTNQLVIISQAETINYAMRKKANLQRNTFLGEFLKGEEVSIE